MTDRMAVACTLLGVVLVGLVSSAAADTVLRNDPFRRPQLAVAPKQPAVTEPVEVPWRPVLRGVLVAGPVSMVNVDGVLVAVGGEINGYRLVRVEEGRATFSGRRGVLIVVMDGYGETRP